MSKSKTEKTLGDIYEALKDLQNTLRLHSEAGLFRFPKIEPQPGLKLYCVAGGTQTGASKPVMIKPGETLPLISWRPWPGHLFMTILSVVMPDATLPYVGAAIRFDDSWMINDWTAEEYNTILGLTPNKSPLVQYGGCTVYDSVAHRYVSFTNWDYFFSRALEVNVKNWTDVEVEIDLFEMQFWSDGDTKFLKLLCEPGIVGW